MKNDNEISGFNIIETSECRMTICTRELSGLHTMEGGSL